MKFLVRTTLKNSFIENPSLSAILPHAFLYQKTSAFYTYVYHVLKICFNSSSLNDELSYLKFVALKIWFNFSVIDKAIGKFKKSVNILF